MRAAIAAGGRLAAGLLTLTATATTCQRAYRFLPPVIRASSPGFQGLLALNLAAMCVREILVGHAEAIPALASWLACAAVTIALRRSRWIHGMALYLAASVGVDLISAAGVQLGVGAALSANWFVAWKLVAAGIGQHQMTLAQRRSAIA